MVAGISLLPTGVSTANEPLSQLKLNIQQNVLGSFNRTILMSNPTPLQWYFDNGVNQGAQHGSIYSVDSMRGFSYDSVGASNYNDSPGGAFVFYNLYHKGPGKDLSNSGETVVNEGDSPGVRGITPIFYQYLDPVNFKLIVDLKYPIAGKISMNENFRDWAVVARYANGSLRERFNAAQSDWNLAVDSSSATANKSTISTGVPPSVTSPVDSPLIDNAVTATSPVKQGTTQLTAPL